MTDAATIDAVFGEVASRWGGLDFVVHAIAFSDKDQLTGRYVDCTAENFSRTLLISCYSFTAIAQRAEKLMANGGSLLTLTYYGAEKWMPHYNVMGVAKAALEASVRYLAADLGEKNIRVNALSAGPIRTLAAAGIGDFRYILKWNELNSPLRRTVTIEEVGDAALYLLSDLVARRYRRSAPCRRRLSHRRHEASRRARHQRRQGLMPNVTLYYVRHGLTDWNIEGRLQGGRDTPLNDRGRAQARAVRRHPARPVRARRPRGRPLPLCVEPAAARERDHGHRAQRARPAARRLCARPAAGGDRLRRLGRPDLSRRAQARPPALSMRARRANGGFRPPGGETYEEVARRVGEWYATLARDTVVTAHGGTARALVGHLGIAPPEQAAHQPIEQGCVYVFADGALTRYA